MTGLVAEVGRGLAAAVAICVAEQDAIVEHAAQEELFGEAPAPRKPGRPEGARNSVTELQAEVIRRSGLSPLAYLASIWRDEARASSTRMQAAIAALPYVHKRQPIAVDLSTHQRITLVIGDVGADVDPAAIDGEFSLVVAGKGEGASNGGNLPVSSSASNGAASNGRQETPANAGDLAPAASDRKAEGGAP